MQESHKPLVVKIIELVGSSPKSWEDAASNAVIEAAKSVRNIKGLDLKHCSATVEKDKIVMYHAVVKVSFDVEPDT